MMTLRAFLLPGSQLRQLAEMCMTVGLEPERFDEMSASCDAETLAHWVEEEWIDVEAAEELREIYRHGLCMLASDWSTRLTPEQVTPALDAVTMRQEPTEDGKPEACVLDLQPAFRADLLRLISEAAADRQIEITLTPAVRDLIGELFPSHSLYLHGQVPVSRRIGPRGQSHGQDREQHAGLSNTLSFQTGLEIFAYSFYGIPELHRLAEARLQSGGTHEAPQGHARTQEPPPAPAVTTDEALDLIELATLLKLASSERLTWVGALEVVQDE